MEEKKEHYLVGGKVCRLIIDEKGNESGYRYCEITDTFIKNEDWMECGDAMLLKTQDAIIQAMQQQKLESQNINAQ